MISAGFVLVAVWWLVFSIPLFRRVPEPVVRREIDEQSARAPIRTALQRLGETVRELRRYRDAFTMMIAFLLYNDGIGAIIRLAAIFAAHRAFSTSTTYGAILAVQFIGIPCAFVFGALATRFGAKRCIFFALGVYVVVTGLAAWMYSPLHFWALALLVGLCRAARRRSAAPSSRR